MTEPINSFTMSDSCTFSVLVISTHSCYVTAATRRTVKYQTQTPETAATANYK